MKRLKELRTNAGLSQQAVATKLGITQQAYANYEHGKRQPDNKTLLLLGELFGVSVDYLLGKDTDALTSTEILSHIGTPAENLLPIIGTIRAGYPIRAEEHIEGWELSNIRNPKDHFFLRVAGDSMINAGITDGCLILIHEQPCANNGQIVACMVNGDDVTLKRFYQHGDIVTLLPENPAYQPIVIPVSDFEDGSARIIGVAKQVVRDL